MQVRALPGSPFGRTATWCGIPSRKRVGSGLGGSTPSPSASVEAWPSGKAARCYRAGRLAAPQVRILLPPLSLRCGRAVRRATVNREAQVRSLPSELVARPCGRTGMTPDSQSGSCGFESRRGCLSNWPVDGRSKGVTEQRLTPKRCVGRNVHPASLRGEGISLAVHDGGWQACRRATDGNGKRSEQRAAPFEGSKALLPLQSLNVCL